MKVQAYSLRFFQHSFLLVFQLNLIYFIADRSSKDSTDARIFLNKDLKKTHNKMSQLSDLMSNFLTHPFSLCKKCFLS